MPRTRHHLRSVPPLVVLLAALLSMPANAVGAATITRGPINDTDDFPRGLSVVPAQTVMPADPGEAVTIQVTVANNGDSDLEVSSAAMAARGSSDATSFVQIAPDAENDPTRNASGWARFPFAKTTVPANTQIAFQVRMVVPKNARPGAHPLLLVFTVPTVQPGSGTQSIGVEGTGGVSSTVVMDVSGDATSQLRITSASGPSVVRSGATSRFRVRVENTGDTLLNADARVALHTPFGGKRNLDAATRSTLPGGRRVFTLTFDDPPLFGRYTPKVTVVGGADSGVRVTRELDAVWVLPPWWLVGALVLAIALPVGMGVARRRRSSNADD